MTIGPVQLLVVGFDHPNFQGEILAELQRLRDDDMVRVIDALAVYKAVGGEVTALKESQLGGEEMAEFGAVMGIAYGDSALEYRSFVPSEVSWRHGDRAVLCAVFDPATGETTGSLFGAAR